MSLERFVPEGAVSPANPTQVSSVSSVPPPSAFRLSANPRHSATG
jgi:hypothetical protein